MWLGAEPRPGLDQLASEKGVGGEAAEG